MTQSRQDFAAALARAASKVAAIVTPTDVRYSDGTVAKVDERPLRWAIENVPGQVAIEDGEYKIGSVAKCPGGRYAALHKHKVRILGGEGDTISMVDGPAIQPAIFEGWYVEGSTRAAWITLDAKGPYRVSWVSCVIDGMWDHGAREGRDSKWGFMPHRWAGGAWDCEFRDIRREHGIYLHTPESNIRIEGCRFLRCGRTGLQVVSRETEGGWSPHVVRVVGSHFEDCGLHDGGSHITAQGVRAVDIVDCTSRIGFDSEFVTAWLAARTAASLPKLAFGTGHFVNWSETSRNLPSDVVRLHNFDAESAPGCGRAAAVQVKNTKSLVLSGPMRVVTGAQPDAIEIDDGPFHVMPNVDVGGLEWDEVDLQGNVTVGGTKVWP